MTGRVLVCPALRRLAGDDVSDWSTETLPLAEDVRLISGSVLSGKAATQEVFSFLGRPEDIPDRLQRLAFVPVIGGMA